MDLRTLIPKVVKLGWAGLEGLGGIPASIGGAIVMNAGGTYGQISDRLTRVHALDREARTITLERGEIDFSYRHSGLNHLLITSAEFRFGEGDAIELRETHRRIMEAKGARNPSPPTPPAAASRTPSRPTTSRRSHPHYPMVQRGARAFPLGCSSITPGARDSRGASARSATSTPTSS